MSELRTITAKELAEILRKHSAWLAEEEDGEHANLGGADLRCADLGGADLRDANLGGADLLVGGQDLRGYMFFAWRGLDDVIIIRAGCRTFVGVAAALAHWRARHTDDSVLHEDCLSLVDRIARMAAVRGWKLES